MGKTQDIDSFRMSEATLTKALQEHFDREIGEGRIEIVDIDLLKRKNLVEVYIVQGGDMAAAAAAAPTESPTPDVDPPAEL